MHTSFMHWNTRYIIDDFTTCLIVFPQKVVEEILIAATHDWPQELSRFRFDLYTIDGINGDAKIFKAPYRFGSELRSVAPQVSSHENKRRVLYNGLSSLKMKFSRNSLVFTVLVLIQLSSCQNITNSKISQKFPTPCTTPNGDEAYCLEIAECRHFKNVQIEPGHEQYDFYMASSCEPSKARLKVCCGKYSNYINKLTPTLTPAPPPATTTPKRIPKPRPTPSDPSAVLLPKECGLNKIPPPTILTSRIFGGTSAHLGEFPWLVRIMRKNKKSVYFGCSGFLVHERFVVTAAHCIKSEAMEALGNIHHVVLGEHDVTTDPDCEQRLSSNICANPIQKALTGQLIVHKSYNATATNPLHDIGLIYLKNPVIFTDTIQPICIPDKPTNIQELVVSGWGRTETDDYSEIKLKVTLDRVAQSTCRRQYAKVDNIQLNQKFQICAGGKDGKDSCTGDSGGPLMGQKDGIWYAEGIVSFGIDCGREDWPGVYTNIANYSNWIKKQIQQKLLNVQKKSPSGTKR